MDAHTALYTALANDPGVSEETRRAATALLEAEREHLNAAANQFPA